MSLNISMDINGEAIGNIVITRPAGTTSNYEELVYRYNYKGREGQISSGTITHRPIDGVMVLATKAMNKVQDALLRPKSFRVN